MELTCGGAQAGAGVELDWARHFWDYRTNSGTLPSNYIMLRQYKLGLQTGLARNNAWQRMNAGIIQYDNTCGTEFYLRWDAIDGINGIEH